MNINFEHAPFEKDLRGFSKEIKEYQAAQKIEKLKEEDTKKFLRTKLAEKANIPVSAQKTTTIVIQESDALPDYLMGESEQIKEKVEGLIRIAFSDGVEKAAKRAAKSGPFILDAFHDAMTSKLYDELKKRGLVK